MNWVPILNVLLYFGVGWILADLVGDDSDEVTMLIFIAWPLVLIILLLMLLLMLITFIIAILMGIIKAIKKHKETLK